MKCRKSVVKHLKMESSRQKKKALAALIFEGVEDSFESSKCYE